MTLTVTRSPVTVTSVGGDILSQPGLAFNAANVRGNAVGLNAPRGSLGGRILPIQLDDRIQGEVLLNYGARAFYRVVPNNNATLNITDTRGQAVNTTRGVGAEGQAQLETFGFLDESVFQDVSIYIVQGRGLRLPADQSEEPPATEGAP